MPLDPAAAQILEMLNSFGLSNPPFQVDAFRAGDAEPMPFPKAEVADVRDVQIAGLTARLYHPRPGETLPVLLFLHGGGWVSGNLETHDPLCRALAARSGLPLLALDYPRAPENRFPAPVEAIYDVLGALEQEAGKLGVDPARIAIGGDSAGGNLAAAACLAARDRGGPAIAHQLLVYPVLDTDFTRPSYRENGSDYFLTTPMMRWFWEQYLGEIPDSPDPLAAPLRAADLAGLPPATIITAEYDPLRDEGEAYAERLGRAGVPVVLERVAGVMHGFASMIGALSQADAAVDIAARDLGLAFRQ